MSERDARAEAIRTAVDKAYSAAARKPQDRHPFPVGREFAESLGYPKERLDLLPSICVEAFTGVSNVSIFADIQQAATVLDLGCGAGMDSLVAAQRVGPSGRVIGIDFSKAMLARARQAAGEAGLSNVRFYHASAESVPRPDSYVDVALVNGLFNLNPARSAIFDELARVVRKGGTVYAAELVLKEALPPDVLQSEQQWFA